MFGGKKIHFLDSGLGLTGRPRPFPFPVPDHTKPFWLYHLFFALPAGIETTFPSLHHKHRKMRLIEGDADCRHLKKLTYGRCLSV